MLPQNLDRDLSRVLSQNPRPQKKKKVRHKVLFLDVVHTKREHAGFKTRHLYPPRNLYDSAAALCGAVVVGSCRIGKTSEVDLDMLRKETTKYWDACARERSGGGKKREKKRVIDSDTGSATSSGRSNSGSSSSGSERSISSSDSDEITSNGDDDDDGSTDEDSASDSSTSGDGSSDASRSESSGSGGPDSARSSRSSGNGDGNVREVGSGDGDSSDGGARGNRDPRAKRKETNIHDGEYRSRRENRVPQSPGSATSDDVKRDKGGGGGSGGGGGGDARKAANASKTGLASGDGASVVKVQQYEQGATRQCPAIYDRANYEETMSVFGRAVRDALKGRCVESIRVPRVLVVHLYNFILREFAQYEHPRLSLAQKEEEEAREGAAGSEGGGRDGGKREAAARKKKVAALQKIKKEAEKAEAKRRAKLGVKAAAEEVRQAKEAAALREAEEEKRRRTQVLMCILMGGVGMSRRQETC